MARRLRKTDGYAAWSKASSEGQLPSEGPAPGVERPLAEVLRDRENPAPVEQPVSVEPAQPEVLKRKSLPTRYRELADRNFDLLVKEVDALEPRDRIRLQEHLADRIYGKAVQPFHEVHVGDYDTERLTPEAAQTLMALIEIVRGDRKPLTEEQQAACVQLLAVLERPSPLSLPAPRVWPGPGRPLEGLEKRADDRANELVSPLESRGFGSMVVPPIPEEEPGTSTVTPATQAPEPTSEKKWYLQSIREPRLPPK